MKKTLLIILTLSLILSICGISAMAVSTHHGSRYTDKNNDGICDNHSESSCFTDENDDGICDNRAENGSGNGHHGQRNGQGNGSHHGKGHHRGHH